MSGQRLICLDPGHGSPRYPGAVHRDSTGKADLVEKDLNLRVAQHLASLLRAKGFAVVLTREGDYTLTGFTGDNLVEMIKREIQARVDVANNAGADLIISIHFNGHDDPTLRGTETYYCKDRPFGDKNKKLAELIQGAMVGSLKRAGVQVIDRGIRQDTIIGRRFGYKHAFMLGANPGFERPSQMPGVIGEPLFVSNDYEASLLKQERILQAVAEGYLEGIIRYFDWAAK